MIVDISYIEDVNPFTSLNNIKCNSKLGNIYKEDVNDGKMALVDWTATALIDDHILYTGKKLFLSLRNVKCEVIMEFTNFNLLFQTLSYL